MAEVVYVDDAGLSYRVNLLRWEQDATLGGATIFNRNNPRVPLLPSTIKMRYVNAYLKSNPSIRRRFSIGNKIALRFGTQGKELIGYEVDEQDFGNAPVKIWVVSSVRGELRQF